MRVNIKLQIAETIGFFTAFALALFAPAGRLDWPAGWIFLGLFFAFYVGETLWLFRHNPGLARNGCTWARRINKVGTDGCFL